MADIAKRAFFQSRSAEYLDVTARQSCPLEGRRAGTLNVEG